MAASGVRESEEGVGRASLGMVPESTCWWGAGMASSAGGVGGQTCSIASVTPVKAAPQKEQLVTGLWGSRDGLGEGSLGGAVCCVSWCRTRVDS